MIDPTKNTPGALDPPGDGCAQAALNSLLHAEHRMDDTLAWEKSPLMSCRTTLFLSLRLTCSHANA